jgi:plastocyanin
MKLSRRSTVALWAVLAATLPTPGLAAPSPAVIHIANFAFIPATVRVAVGQPVSFVNDDSEPHTASAVDRSFDSGGLDLHDSWQHTFTAPGTHRYFCEMHPTMTGTIVVTAAAAR